MLTYTKESVKTPILNIPVYNSANVDERLNLHHFMATLSRRRNGS